MSIPPTNERPNPMKPYKWITLKFQAHTDPENTSPVTIPCETKKHYPPYADTDLHLVHLTCNRYRLGETKLVRIFTGACEVCANRYAYTPDATPAQMDIISREMEKTR